jgi:hypothetical protein
VALRLTAARSPELSLIGKKNIYINIFCLNPDFQDFIFTINQWMYTMRKQFSKIALAIGFGLALLVPTIIGCVPTARQPESALAECGSDEFSGFGIGESENEALTEARSSLAMRISSSIKRKIERTDSQRVSNGKEDLTEGTIGITIIESDLPNAHDARIAFSKRNGSKINAVVCMSRPDAAKGFLERQRLVLDSLGMVSNTALTAEHPRRKNEAWHRTQMLHNDFMRIQRLLEGWDFKSPYSADEIYSKAKEDNISYCQDMKVFWQDAGNECSGAAFAVLSKKIKMEKSECLGGLKLSFNCPEKCAGSSLGIECSFNPSLAVESCGGEKYSMLKVKEQVTGSDMHNKNTAKENLMENLSGAAFFKEWEREIMEWVPRCAE